MNLIINAPDYVKNVEKRIIENGYLCFLVGGCIRDTLLGKDVKDYDLTTNCQINILLKIFENYHIINKNGEKHNTLTIHIDGFNVEITTFKHEEYEDNSIEVDLTHRDLTINALAYGNKLIDVVGGYYDLKNKIIRAPIDPEKRFQEDPLRILRALRFSSQLGFTIETNTQESIHECMDLLRGVSKERIKKEFEEMLEGANLYNVLNEYYDVLFLIIPELSVTYNFDQKNKYHKNTLYKHIINVCCNIDQNAKNKSLIRMAALLHDIAKPKCFTIDKNGNGHFYGHAEAGSIMALDILKRLKYSNSDIEKIIYLIKYHDSTINLNKKSIRKNFSHTPNEDEELFYMLLELMNADKLDHTVCELIDIDRVKAIMDEIKKNDLCLKISDLKVNGNDMMRLGFKGKDIGNALNYLLECVIDEDIVNEKDELINKVIKYKNNN